MNNKSKAIALLIIGLALCVSTAAASWLLLGTEYGFSSWEYSGAFTIGAGAIIGSMILFQINSDNKSRSEQ